ncbi:MAG: rhomboid family intramembrane serine protease [Abitibacteriaceae bacterium]|nr:rhomboid family intramembrane serine protease [Abditibacteriaceae bacterium]
MPPLFGVLFATPLLGLVVLIQLFFSTAFIPYKVERPTRRVPYFTYGLIGVNVFIFFVTVLIANVNLGADHIEGAKAKQTLMDKYGANAEKTALDQADNAKGFQQLWQIQHANSSYVLEPHYSVLNIFAYRPAEPSFFGKIVGLFGSMFLHGGLLHLAGNMLYLWVFGRALEEELGPLIFAGAYLLSGVAATLLYHIMIMQFTPQSAGLPLTGASGAIAGVLGLFALRFYRTPVNIFYIQTVSLVIVLVVSAIAGVICGLLLGIVGFVLGFFGVWIGFLIYMRKTAFGTFKIPSAWAIGIWLLVFNLLPGIVDLFQVGKQGGTAHWAHIGGFVLGMIYALLIGSKEEGQVEYMLEDAQKALASGNTENAVSFSENLLQREPNNAGAYEVIAKSYDRTNNEDAALDNYELAINRYIQSGEREKAAQLYLDALRKHTHFILGPEQQLIVGNQMAKDSDFQNAAETLVKIPYTFPEAPEGEVSLLRSAQLYLEHLKDPQMASQLLAMFMQRYPDTHWMPQAERALKIAQFQLSQPEDGAGELGLTGPVAAPPAPTRPRP